jgi:hypothetical protein
VGRSTGRSLLRLPPGQLLATAPDGRTVLALIRNTVSGRDSVAVIDAQSLQTRCRHPLEHRISYSGLLLGRSGMFYAYGCRPTHPLIAAQAGALGTRGETLARSELQ